MNKQAWIWMGLALLILLLTPVQAKAAVNVKEGTYYFYTGLGNRVLDVKGAGKSNGTNVQIYTPNKTKAQQFKVQKVGKYYKIINVNSGKALDVKGGSTKNKANIQQYKYNGTKAQLWTFESAGSGYYYLKNVGSGKVLDVAGGKTKNGTNVWQYKLNRSKAQKWKLVKATFSSQTVKKSYTQSELKNIYKKQINAEKTAYDKFCAGQGFDKQCYFFHDVTGDGIADLVILGVVTEARHNLTQIHVYSYNGNSVTRIYGSGSYSHKEDIWNVVFDNKHIWGCKKGLVFDQLYDAAVDLEYVTKFTWNGKGFTEDGLYEGNYNGPITYKNQSAYGLTKITLHEL